MKTATKTGGRLAAVIHYVIARTEPAKLGATKLNKVLWYSDIEQYRRTGKSVTGLLSYTRMPRGPVPVGGQKALNILKQEGKISERAAQVYNYKMREFVWLKEPDLSLFDADEIDILNQIIDLIQDHSAASISELTHDALWDELENGEEMSVKAASVFSRTPTKKELSWAEAL